MAKFTLDEVATAPPAPAVGKLVFYAKTDDAVYVKNSAGVEIALGVSNAIDQLTGDVTAIGPGSAVASVDFVGGETAADVATSVNDTQAATSSNTPSTIVKRDGSGNFSAGTITASLTGNVTGNVSGSAASITGLNPIANGGTNSSTALNNNRVMQSSGGAIVEAAAITAGKVLSSDVNGIPVATVHTIDSSTRLVMGSAFLSKVIALIDAATIATDASLGNTFTVTLGGNRTLGNPTNPIDGQKITYRFRQDGTGSRTLAFDTDFRFGLDIISVVLSTGANKTDYVGFIYNSTDSKWDCVAVAKGF